MATVFLAEDCVLGREVAIKRLHSARSDIHEQRFRREARIGASLMHPNLVTIFDTLSAREGLLIVMEYVRGEPLLDLIGPDGMAPSRVIEILRPVGAALDYAHENGVVHRDVKPANILIGDGGWVKLVDLGTAHAANATQITMESEVVGTLAYIAPERLAGDSAGEPPADVYSLAVVAFEAFSGRKPHQAETPAELLAAVDEGPPDLTEVPPQLGRVLAQGMDPDPGRRQPSALALVTDLERAVAASEAPGTMEVVPTQPMTVPVPPEPELPLLAPARPNYTPRRGARWAAPLALALCAALAIGVWLVVSGNGGSSGGGSGGQTSAEHARTTSTGAAQRGTGSGAADTAAGAPTATSSNSSGATSSTDPATLNDEGYALIQEGRYTDAIPVLRHAVASFPAGTTDLTYAYALYNLGHALRLAGRPDEAIPILERRLQIPDQTATVQAELDAARAEAGH
jgi:serine/threonine protein kinase